MPKGFNILMPCDIFSFLPFATNVVMTHDTNVGKRMQIVRTIWIPRAKDVWQPCKMKVKMLRTSCSLVTTFLNPIRSMMLHQRP